MSVVLNKRSIKAKRDFEEAAKEAELIVRGVYVDNITPLEVICKNGHTYLTTPKKVKAGYGCKKCSGQCPEEAEKKVRNVVKERGWSQLTPYVNASTDILFRCDIGHELLSIPSNFLRMKGCPVCTGHSSEGSKNKFLSAVISSDYEMKGVYVDSKTKILLICPHGHEYTCLPKEFIKGKRCRKCRGLCPEEAGLRFKSVISEAGYKLRSVYVNSRTDVSIECPVGHLFKRKPADFISIGMSCPDCTGLGKGQCEKKFRLAVEEAKYEFSGVFSGSKSKVSLVCPEGHDCKISPNNFLRGTRCAKCSGHCTDQARSDFYNIITGVKYTALGEYQGASIPVKILCDHHHVISMTPSNLKAGYRCRFCSGHNHNVAYINTIIGTDFVKYGITTNHRFDLRIKEANRNNKLEAFKLGWWLFEDPKDCINAENECKALFAPVVSKFEMPDGYTETTWSYNTDKIIEIYERNGGVRIE